MKPIKGSEVEARLFVNGNLIFPETIKNAIISCLKTDYNEIDAAKSHLASAYKGDYISPPDVRYESDATIDAYTIDYLPRNFFIPRIAIRDLSLSPNASKFNEVIRVLDIGSGTGAVALGVFELFSKAPLNRYGIDLLALDRSEKALIRQNELIKSSGVLFRGNKFEHKVVKLDNTNEVDRILSSSGKWDLIVSANFMVELNDKTQNDLLKILAKYLSDNGSIIIAEPAQDRGKKVIANAAKLSKSLDLSIFYPCHDSCRKGLCWTWRQYQVEYIPPYLIKNKMITFSDKSLIVSMIILNGKGATIFDIFKEEHPNLNWGIIAPFNKDSNDYEICSLELKDDPNKYKRGSIVGWEKSRDKVIIKEYREL